MKKRMEKKLRKGIVVGFFLLFIGITCGCVKTEESKGVCRWDFKVRTTDHIGNYYQYLKEYQWEAREGYIFAIVTIRIVNNASKTVSTNPWNWRMVINGVEYLHHTATYDDEINQITVDVGKGGDVTTEIVYEIPADATSYELKYTGLFPPKMVRDDTLL